jgi:ribonuclease BN (tRNA processing enzyme)
MKLTVIGSADAFNSAGRGHSCYLIEGEGTEPLMLDFGPTALLGLRRAGRTPNEVGGVAFTHLHGDHTGGFPFLLIDALFNSRRGTGLNVLGPERTREFLSALQAATYDDLAKYLEKYPLDIHELAPGSECEFLGYRVAAFAADHMEPPHRPLCLRFHDKAGKSVAFSGDTRPCPGMFAAADGADLFVAECTRLAQPAGEHCTWEDWQRELPRLGCGRVLFTHLGADVRERAPVLSAEYQSLIPFQFAEDGMILEL